MDGGEGGQGALEEADQNNISYYVCCPGPYMYVFWETKYPQILSAILICIQSLIVGGGGGGGRHPTCILGPPPPPLHLVPTPLIKNRTKAGSV